MNEHLTKDAPQETFPTRQFLDFIRHKCYHYIPKLLANIKLWWSQYIATSVINYGLYIGNMFALKNLTYTFCRQLVKVITSTSHHHITDPWSLMAKYNQLLNNWSSETIFLFWQIIKKHSKFDHAWTTLWPPQHGNLYYV